MSSANLRLLGLRVFRLALLAAVACGPASSEDLGTASGAAQVCASGPTIEGIDVSHWDGPIDWNAVIFNMLTIKGIYGREIFETWYKMSVMIQSGLDLSPIITHRLPYHKFEEGFETMLEGKSGKIVLNWE